MKKDDAIEEVRSLFWGAVGECDCDNELAGIGMDAVVDFISDILDERDKAEARVAELEAEVERLRKALLSALSATRAKVDADCSTDLLCAGADEIRLYCTRLWREMAEVQASADRMKADAEQAVLEARNREAELAGLLRRIVGGERTTLEVMAGCAVVRLAAVEAGRAALAKQEGG